MINMEERVNFLDSIMAELARAQVQTEMQMNRIFARMDARMAETNARMEASDARMKEDTRLMQEDTRLMKEDTRLMKEDTRQMKEDTRQMKEDTRLMKEDTRLMKEDTADLREGARRMQKAWGDLANKMGTVAEDVVAPNIPRLALEEFRFGEVEDLMVRVRRASRRGEKRQSEWDVICSGPTKVIVVDVKSTPTLEKIREVPGRIAEFFDFFPEYEGRELIGIFASWAIDPRLLPAVSEAGLYAIAMGEETMDIVARPAGLGA
jgi:hypothetical protein